MLIIREITVRKAWGAGNDQSLMTNDQSMTNAQGSIENRRAAGSMVVFGLLKTISM